MTDKRKLRRWLVQQYEFMRCANLLEFKQRLQWLSEGMLRNHITATGHEINHWEVELYNTYARKLKELQKMTDKIMMDGEPLEVGNEVYCLSNGKGKVERINNKSIFPIEIAFQHGYCTYTKNFKAWTDHENRTLYWQRPEIIPTPKPKKKVKVCDWFVQDDEDKPIKRLNGYTEESLCYYICQKIDGTEREVER